MRPDSPDRREFLTRLTAGALSISGVAAGGWVMGRGSAKPVACVRPPGARPEAEFLATCIRCGRCGDACPNCAILTFTEATGKDLSMRPGPGQRGTPVVFPRRQACMLCVNIPGETLLCTAACPSGALRRVQKSPESILANVKMGTAEVDRRLCYSFNGASCGACVRACPFEGKALRAGLWEKPLLDPQACVGCGLCERACLRYPQAIRVRPASAAYYKRSVAQKA